jgi:hypothetical protein
MSQQHILKMRTGGLKSFYEPKEENRNEDLELRLTSESRVRRLETLTLELNKGGKGHGCLATMII